MGDFFVKEYSDYGTFILQWFPTELSIVNSNFLSVAYNYRTFLCSVRVVIYDLDDTQSP